VFAQWEGMSYLLGMRDAETDADGVVRFPNVPAGDVVLQLVGRVTPKGESNVVVSLAAGERRETITLRAQSTQSITGTVLGADEKPATNVFVRAMPLGGGDVVQAITDERGRFVVGNLMDVRYTLTATTANRDATTDLEASPGDDVTLELWSRHHVELNVTNAGTRVTDFELACRTLDARASRKTISMHSRSLHANRLKAVDAVRITCAVSTEVGVAVAKTWLPARGPLDLPLSPAAVVTGRVTRDGKPTTELVILHDAWGFEHTFETTRTGVFTFDRLPPGDVTIRIPDTRGSDDEDGTLVEKTLRVGAGRTDAGDLAVP
jgi:hypothetical protein